MTTPEPIILPQNTETNIARQRKGNFHYRYAYSRSADTQKANDLGQDFLAFSSHKNRFAFALCDGVSQSFYGDLGASILGTKLLQWFWGLDIRQHHEKASALLRNELLLLAEDATSQVSNFIIPDHVPNFVLPALEKKRAIGSESTFVAGVLDKETQTACFAWMGDSRLKVWQGKEEILAPFEGRFLTSERWSTRKGPVGELHLITLSLSELDHFTAYSDGLSILDSRFKNRKTNNIPLSDVHINDAIEQSGRLPSSDDISFLDLWIGGHQPKYPPSTKTKAGPKTKHENNDGVHKLSWPTLPNVTSYEIEIRSDFGVLKTFKTHTPFWQQENPLEPQARYIVVRGWWDEEPGGWSDVVTIKAAEEPIKKQPKPTSTDFKPSILVHQVPPIAQKPVSPRETSPYITQEPQSVSVSAEYNNSFVPPPPKRKFSYAIAFGSVLGLIFLAIFISSFFSGDSSGDEKANAPGKISLTTSASILETPKAATSSIISSPTNTQQSPSTPIFTQSKATTVDEDCSNLAEIITAPETRSIPVNENFTIVWEIKNIGTCNWTPEYAAVQILPEDEGDTLISIQNEDFSQKEYRIEIMLTAPTSTGEHSYEYKIRSEDGTRFGIGKEGQDSLKINFTVVANPTPTQ
jgi:hypothetical protein